MFILVDGPISWLIKKQSTIALSSTEAEYRGVVNAATQCLWLQGILEESSFESETSPFIYYENKRTIRISTNLVQKQQTKHIDIHMHYIRELVHDGTIALLYYTSSEQVANIFTKVFCEKTFINLKSLLGIIDHVVKND